MIVSELIEILKKADSEAIINTWYPYYDRCTDNVSVSEMRDNTILIAWSLIHDEE